MVGVAVAEPRPGSFKQHDSSTPKLVSKVTGELETRLPELTEADSNRASSIHAKPVETDIEFDQQKEEQICRPGSFFQKAETPRAQVVGSPSEQFNKTILPNLTPDDVQKASSIVPKRVEDISVDTETEEKIFRPGSFATKVETVKPRRLDSTTPSQVFNSDLVLPELTPKDLQKASSIAAKKVSGDISLSFDYDEGQEGEYSKAANEELKQSMSANNSSHSPRHFVPMHGSNCKPNTPIDGDISFTFVGNVKDEESAYKRAAEEELRHSKTGLRSGSLSPTRPSNNSHLSTSDVAIDATSNRNNGELIAEDNNQDKGNASGEHKAEEDNKPNDEADNVRTENDDFQIDESITKLEALLDNALDDQIAATFRDSHDDESTGDEEDDENIARQKAELEAAFQELAKQEAMLNQSFGVNDVVEGGNIVDSNGDNEDVLPLVDDPELRDSLLEFESLLESALTDDEVEISFTDPHDESDGTANKESNDTRISSNMAKSIQVNKPAVKPVNKPAKKPETHKPSANPVNKPAQKPAGKSRNSLSRFARGTSSSTAKGGVSSRTKEASTKPNAAPTKGPLRSMYNVITGKKRTQPVSDKPNPATKPLPKPTPTGLVSRPKPKPVEEPKPKVVESRFRSRPVAWQPKKLPPKLTVASKPKSPPVVSKPKIEGSSAAPVGLSKAGRSIKKTSARLNQPSDPQIPSPPKICRAVDNVKSHDTSYSVLSLPALPALPTSKTKAMSMSTSLSASKVFTKFTSYFLDGSSATINSFNSPRRAGRFTCKFKYQLDAHPTRGPCELCYYHLNPEDKASFDTNGYHLRVMMCTGGCDRGCAVFPRQEEGQAPVRLCRVCFFNTHRDSYNPKKKEYKKRVII